MLHNETLNKGFENKFNRATVMIDWVLNWQKNQDIKLLEKKSW